MAESDRKRAVPGRLVGATLFGAVYLLLALVFATWSFALGEYLDGLFLALDAGVMAIALALIAVKAVRLPPGDDSGMPRLGAAMVATCVVLIAIQVAVRHH